MLSAFGRGFDSRRLHQNELNEIFDLANVADNKNTSIDTTKPIEINGFRCFLRNFIDIVV